VASGTPLTYRVPPRSRLQFSEKMVNRLTVSTTPRGPRRRSRGAGLENGDRPRHTRTRGHMAALRRTAHPRPHSSLASTSGRLRRIRTTEWCNYPGLVVGAARSLAGGLRTTAKHAAIGGRARESVARVPRGVGLSEDSTSRYRRPVAAYWVRPVLTSQRSERSRAVCAAGSRGLRAIPPSSRRSAPDRGSSAGRRRRFRSGFPTGRSRRSSCRG
jgi:hypothetical protein